MSAENAVTPRSTDYSLSSVDLNSTNELSNLDTTGVSTASLPMSNDHLSLQFELGTGFIEDELYSSGIFHGAATFESLNFFSDTPGDYFFVLLMDQACTSNLNDESLHFVVAKGRGLYGLIQIYTTSDPSAVTLYGYNEKFTDVQDLIEFIKAHQTQFFGRKIMTKPVKRFSWMVPVSNVKEYKSLGHCRALASCDGIPYHRDNLVFHRLNNNPVNARKIFNEVKVLSKLNHVNIVKFYAFTTFHEIAVITGYCEKGSLSAMIHNNVGYTENLTDFNKICILFQLSEALIYLKSRAIVHRRIEPKNILLTANLDVKLSNFSYAGVHTAGMMQKHPSDLYHSIRLRYVPYKNEELAQMEFPMKELPDSVLENILKESAYIAPETALRHVFSCQSDVWQFAMTMYELYSQKQPFHFTSGQLYRHHNLLTSAAIWMTIPLQTNSGLQTIFKKCITKTGGSRMKIEKVKRELHNLLVSLNESRV